MNNLKSHSGDRIQRTSRRWFTIIGLTLAALFMFSATASAAPFVQPNEGWLTYKGYSRIGAPPVNGNENACSFVPSGTQSPLPSSYECAVWRVKTFMQDTYTAQGYPVVAGYQAMTQLGFGSVVNGAGNLCAWNAQSNSWCSITGMVSGGVDGLTQYDNGSKSAVALLIAHETGHAIGSAPWSGGLNTLTQGFAYKSAPEDQADCIAGVFTSYGISKNWWGSSMIEYGKALFEAFGNPDAANSPFAHNTPEGRRNAYLSGVNGGLDACNAIVTDRGTITPWK